MRNPTFTANVNFQDSTVPVVSGYLVDNFLGYGARGNGYTYGWVTQASVLDADPTVATAINPALYPTSAISERNGAPYNTYNPLLRGYAHFDQSTYPSGDGSRVAWEMAVANGWYEVTVAVGDTGGPNDSINRLYIEGTLASSFVPTNLFKTELVTALVNVTDGHLTLSAQGGTQTEIQYLQVKGQLPDLTPADGNPAPADYPVFIDPRAVAQDGSQISEVNLDPATGFASNVDPDSDFFLGVSLVPGREGISLQSLTDGSIHLYETLTGAEVAFNANTTGGHDSVTISPENQLKALTSYTLVVDGAQDNGAVGVAGSATRDFGKFTTTFLTGNVGGSGGDSLPFANKLVVDGAADGAYGYASVLVSPDGHKLYVSTLNGEIIGWDIDPSTGTPIAASKQVFTPGGDFDAGAAGRRAIVGMAFDPSHPDTLWISDNYPVPLDGIDGSVPDFSGRISKVHLGSGGSLATASVETYITGLPRSSHDHLTNSIAFRANPDYGSNASEPQYLLYVNQGSNTAMGAADSAWSYRPERLLSGAVLEIDPTRTAPTGGFDVTTEPVPANQQRFADVDNNLKNGSIAITSGTYAGNYLRFASDGVASVWTAATGGTQVRSYYDPYAANAVVSIYATGIRNAYDLVWHSNGSLYVPANGSAAGGSTPDNPATAADESRTNVSLQHDYLFTVSQGGYYGHPNPLRDNFILNGGNPTAGTDPNEVPDYAVGTNPDPNYVISKTYNLGDNRSPDGAIEYLSTHAGSAFQHTLLFTEFSGGDDIRAIKFDSSGHIVRDYALRDPQGNIITYADPLDLAENPETGQIYLITLQRATGQSQLVVLTPTPAPLHVEAESLTLQQGFAVVTNTNASGAQMLQATGPSTEARASYTFDEASGYYTLDIKHFDENDGVAWLSVEVNGVVQYAYLWDKALGSPNATAATLTTETIRHLHLEAGDVITLAGRSVSTEPLRTDYFDLTFEGATLPSETTPVNTAPTTATVSQPNVLSFTGSNAVSVADADGDRVTTVLNVDHGTLALASGGGADIITNASKGLIVSGTAAQVNSALAGLTFTATSGYSGGATLSIATSDGSHTDTDQVAITVQPFGNANSDIGVQSLDPVYFADRLQFNYIDEPNTQGTRSLIYKDMATVRISSTGTEALSISGYTITGPYVLVNPAQLNNVTLQPGQFLDVAVKFDRTAFTARQNTASALVEGDLTINTNDLEDPHKAVHLEGLWQRVDEGGWEPNVNEIWQAFGFGNRIPGMPTDDSASPLNQGGVYQQFNSLEVLSPYWEIAPGVTAAKITQIAQYAGRGTAELSIHRPFNKGTEAVSLTTAADQSQRLLPTKGTVVIGSGGVVNATYSSATFTGVTIPDGWQGNDVFGIHVANYSTDPSLNQVGDNPPTNAPLGSVFGQWLRIFQATDANGVIIPNVYLGVQDFAGSNGDYNDNLFIIEGVRPASHAPTNTAPTSATTAEDVGVTFSGANVIKVADVDGAALTPTMTTYLTVGHGAITIVGTGATVTGNGTAVVTVSGTIAQVNTTLAGLVYTPSADYNGTDTLTVKSVDGALSGTSTVAINITPVDDAPRVASATAANVTSTGGTSGTVTVQYQDDGSLDAATIGTDDITITGPSGALLTVTGVSVSPAGNGSPLTVTYTYTAPGGTWDVGDTGTYTVGLKANQVFDTTGHAAVANAALTTFTASLPALRVEAESMTLQNYSVNALPTASGGSLIKTVNTGTHTASYVFGGADGTYNLTTTYWDENDGTASLSISVNGSVVDSFIWNQNLGTPNTNNTSKTTHLTSAVALHPGDVVVLTGVESGGEPARVDAVDFQFVSSLPPVNRPPSVTSASIDNVTTAGGTTSTLTVVYADDTGVDVSSIGVGDVTITGPGGALTVTGVSVSPAGNGTPRTVTYTVAAPGGTWDRADNGSYTVALKANEVFDTGGASSTANGSLTSFTVNIPAPAPIHVEAESMTLQNYSVNSLPTASGGALIKTVNTGTHTATHVFSGADGTYDLTTTYWDENDGTASLSISVNGSTVDSFIWNQNLGTPNTNNTSKTTHLTSAVALHPGDVVVLTGVESGGEPARVDAVDFQFISSLPAVNRPPSVTSASIDNVTASGGTTSTLTVVYSDDTGVDVSSIGVGDVTITGPGGALTVSSVSVSPAGNGTPRTVTYTVAAAGGTWDRADNGTYTVALKANEVFDTGGASSAANGSLATFAVNIPAPAPIHVEAESMTLQNYSVNTLSTASGGSLIKAVNGDPHKASHVFSGPDGTYNLTTTYWDENDGTAQLSISVNGTTVDSFLWDQNLGSANATNATKTTHVTAGLSLHAGDTVELVALTTAAEPGRIDALDYLLVG